MASIRGRAETFDAVDPAHTLESSISTISWTAIIGGAFAAAALSLILLLSGLASARLQCHHSHTRHGVQVARRLAKQRLLVRVENQLPFVVLLAGADGP